ncbi:MAG: thiamine pyrophosphate-binding protein [Pelagibacteraceae bacterium]|nr:thiamine pyrophosphate-binding protein [Pelagibacteraceae bacterium]MBL6861379.1 thiamine pyrophosphate-binding protein [Candidatus Pelagibacter bacterium]
MRVVDFIVKFLKQKKINDIFMLTGYGAMYLNDAVKLAGIKYYATRNEATAPSMASAYARIKNKVGVACVTAGPGATNALPGLAEAYVDSSPIVILSGQVDYKQTTHSTNSKNIRSFGTAEINIIPIVKPLTKYAEIIKNPLDVKYIIQKAFHLASSGRKGPVWIDIPLNVQKAKINEKKLKSFIPKIKNNTSLKNNFKKDFNIILNSLEKSKKPILILGHGVKQSDKIKEIKKIIDFLKIPVIFTRFTNDLIPHNKKYIYGISGIKATKFSKKIMNQADLAISFGCRFSPQFVGHDYKALSNAKVISVDIEKDELYKKGQKIDIPMRYDLTNFLPSFLVFLKKKRLKKFIQWNNHCDNLKKDFPIIYKVYNKDNKSKLMDLYYFMDRLGKISSKKNILVTDAGSNYYIGGQVWNFEKNQKELSSYTNAAMGLSIPLSIGAAVASPKSTILSVTGDGSLELNIQELKTISHNKFNIKLFVINNGGYVSMHNWADTFFRGRRVDNPIDTGDGTLNLKNIAKAFDMDYFLIPNSKNLDFKLKKINNIKKPLFVEVLTDNKQIIYDAYKDY